MAAHRFPVLLLPLIGGIALAFFAGATSPARAFDLFGLFGGDEKKPPPPTAATLPYTLDFDGLPDADLKAVFRETSILARLIADPPTSGEELVRRADSDLPRLVDLLWGNGYYAADLAIEIAGERLTIGSGNRARAASRADQSRGNSLVPLRFVAAPGPLYRFASIRLVDQTGRPVPEARVPARLYEKLAGEPAQSAALGVVAGRIADHVRGLGHPFARIADPAPVVDHRLRTVVIELRLAEGPLATIGDVALSATDGIDPRVIRSHIYLDRETLYSPQRISDIRRSVGRIEAVGSVRVKEAEALAPDGTLPLDVAVTARPKRVLGGAATYSTVDGPSLKAYWAHRNLFGGAERLRIEGELFYLANAPKRLGRSNSKFDTRHLGGRLGIGFIKPALAGSRVDFVSDVTLLRNTTTSYSTRLANAVAALRYRFADKTWVQAGIEGEIGKTTDVLGRQRYSLIGLPVSGRIDTTDSDLDPHRGYRFSGGVTPYLGLGDAARFFTVAKAEGSAYRALDGAERYVLAGRVALASIIGGRTSEIPANRRLYAGGGGSVRGFEFQSLGPRNAAGQLIGGRSLFEASVELRMRLTDTIGIVPFLDAGTAFSSSVPKFDTRVRLAAGLGLRYYTTIGPIRVDFAAPLDRRKGEKPVAFYISLGQAF